MVPGINFSQNAFGLVPSKGTYDRQEILTAWRPAVANTLDIERGPFHPREHASIESNIDNNRRRSPGHSILWTRVEGQVSHFRRLSIATSG